MKWQGQLRCWNWMGDVHNECFSVWNASEAVHHKVISVTARTAKKRKQKRWFKQNSFKWCLNKFRLVALTTNSGKLPYTALVFGKDGTTSYPSWILNIHSMKTVFSIVVYLTFDSMIIIWLLWWYAHATIILHRLTDYNDYFMYHFLPRDALQCKARYCDRMSSVCLSVCNVSELWSHMLEFFEINFTVS